MTDRDLNLSSPASSGDGDWVDSQTAIDVVVGNDFADPKARKRATEAIQRRLEAGLTFARAPQHIYFSDESEAKVIPAGEPLPPRFWKYVREHGDLCDWTLGDFGYSRFILGTKRDCRALGVQFDRRGLPKRPSGDLNGTMPAAQSRGGRLRKWDWDKALLHLWQADGQRDGRYVDGYRAR